MEDNSIKIGQVIVDPVSFEAKMWNGTEYVTLPEAEPLVDAAVEPKGWGVEFPAPMPSTDYSVSAECLDSATITTTQLTAGTGLTTTALDNNCITAVSSSDFVADNTMRLTLDNHIESYVTVKANGEVEFGPGYTPDAAARTFWMAMGIYRNQDIPTEGPISKEISQYIDKILQPEVTRQVEEIRFYRDQIDTLGDFLMKHYDDRIIGSAVETAIDILAKDIMKQKTLDSITVKEDPTTAYNRAMGAL